MPEHLSLGSWIREIISNVVSHPMGQALASSLGKIWDGLTPGDMRYIRFKTTGTVPLEDENLIRRARAELRTEDPNLDRELSRKLTKLEPHMQDYYRLAVVGLPDPDPNKPKSEDDRYRIEGAKKTMRRDAEMTEAEWDQEIINMNFNQPKTESVAKKIKDALVGDAKTELDKLFGDIEQDLGINPPNQGGAA